MSARRDNRGAVAPPVSARGTASPLLDLVANQINAALGEAKGSFSGLTGAVLTLASRDDDRPAAALEPVLAEALTHLQAVDRLEQRLDHIVADLRSLGVLLARPADAQSERDWHALLRDVRARYTTDAERVEFDRVFPRP